MMEQDKMELLRIGADDAEEFGVLSETIRGRISLRRPAHMLCKHIYSHYKETKGAVAL